ncbi:hypothetical protein [Geopseudomonas aromaticivorans]
MRGGEKVRLRQRLRALQKAAEAGDRGAAGEARLLEAWLEDDDAISAKRADDRVKVLVGAWVAAQMKAGHPVVLDDASALLAAMDGWLVRPMERLAVLGQDRQGSPAFRRVTG